MRRVLVLDDSSMNLKMAERALQDVCKPILVPSGRLALKYLENNDADLILLDVLMPEMDGFETMDKLKANAKTASIPVVFLTADTDEDTRKRGNEKGALGYII